MNRRQFLKPLRALSLPTVIGALGNCPLTSQKIQEVYAFRSNYVDWDKKYIGAPEMELSRKRHMPVMVWTVDSEARMRELIAIGITSISTNKPALLKKLFADSETPVPAR